MALLVVGAFSETERREDASGARVRPQHPGPGSYRLLEMLARLGVAGVEPLACALRISVSTTYDHID